MKNTLVLLITIEGKEIIISQFPYTFKKNNQKVYFILKKLDQDFQIENIAPYKVKIMDDNLIEQKSPKNLNKILIIKSSQNQETIHNFGEKINLKDDNVINTVTFINIDNYQKQQENFFSGEKLINLINFNEQEQKTRQQLEKFYPQFVSEPIFKNPIKITSASQININLWTFEERELLKKALLSFGYGRWDKIKLSFEKKQHLGLREKTISEIRAYSNSLLKSISDNLNFQNFGLKHLMIYILEQCKELPQQYIENEKNQKFIEKNKQLENDNHIVVNSKDWDLNSIRQRAKPWAKRILIMYRINNFMQDYILFFKNKYQRYPQTIFDFSFLLNFINSNLLMGQKPAPWWTLLHDIHLLHSTYFNGYTNILHSFIIKNSQLPSTWYFYKKGEKNIGQTRKLNYMNKKIDFYSEIIVLSLPNADAITRRLKKLISIIFKLSNENLIEEEKNDSLNTLLNVFTKEDKINFIEYVKIQGVPYNKDQQKFSFDDLRSRLNLHSEVSIDQVQEFFNMINLTAFITLTQQPLNQENLDQYDQNLIEISNLFTKESAEEYLRNNNILYYWRHVFDLNTVEEFFYDYEVRLKSFLGNQDKDYYYMNEFYNFLNLDTYLKIFKYIQSNGFYQLEEFSEKLGFSEYFVMMNHIFLFFEFLKPEIENSNPSIQKKRKIEFQFHLKNQTKKNDDDEKFYFDNKNEKFQSKQISSSLKLLDLGQIIPEPYYHTEHSLFPIGYRSIRIYYSMIHPGIKCEYLCEILQGNLRPLFKVTSTENQQNPLISEDPTFCWNQIYQKSGILNNKIIDKLAISGTERFGLLDPQVGQYLEKLPNVDKCSKYIKKYNNQFENQNKLINFIVINENQNQ